jgi:alpha-tubulin suppressor-like RCC1 family protein
VIATLRPLIVAALAVALVAATGSGRAGTSPLLAATRGSGGSASATASATAIAAGLIHSCALTSTGSVKCWGYNGHNELGNGTTTDRWMPVDVSGLSGGVTAIAAGLRHGCALTSSGAVKCWGYNYYGQLGDGTTSNRSTPVDVSGLSGGVTAIAGAFHSCAITRAGGVKCWGLNDYGQLGDGTTSGRSTPVDVSGLSGGVTAIAVGSAHSCALSSAGGVKCWGANYYGQLGDGTTSDRSTPVDVSGLRGGVTAIAAGGLFTCSLTSAGGVKCWGLNAAGQLGDGTTRNRSTPVDVSGLRGGVTAIAADRGRGNPGEGHSCALTSVGGVKCWGYNNNGQLGDGTTRNRSTPLDVSGLRGGVTAISAGGRHSCALTRTGGVKCWGYNSFHQLGDGATGSNVDRLRPVDVVGFGAAKATLAIVSSSVTVTPARGAAIKLRCGVAARCQGVLALSASVRGRLVSTLRPRVTVTLGRHKFWIAPGRTATVNVKLTGRGFKLLVRVKRLPAQVRISYKQAAGGTTPATRTITLTAPKAVKR